MEAKNTDGIPEELQELQEGAVPQTETNPELDEMIAGAPEISDQASPQTETESVPDGGEETDHPLNSQPAGANPQTDLKPPKKPGRRKKTGDIQLSLTQRWIPRTRSMVMTPSPRENARTPDRL